jgi:hypothetical protein
MSAIGEDDSMGNYNASGNRASDPKPVPAVDDSGLPHRRQYESTTEWLARTRGYRPVPTRMRGER